MDICGKYGSTYDGTTTHSAHDIRISTQTAGRITVKLVPDGDVVLSVRSPPARQVSGIAEVQEVGLVGLGRDNGFSAQIPMLVTQSRVENEDSPVLLNVTGIRTRIVHGVTWEVNNSRDVRARERLAVVERRHKADADTLVVKGGAVLSRCDVSRTD